MLQFALIFLSSSYCHFLIYCLIDKKFEYLVIKKREIKIFSVYSYIEFKLRNLTLYKLKSKRYEEDKRTITGRKKRMDLKSN